MTDDNSILNEINERLSHFSMDYTTIRNINEKLVIRKSKSKRRKVTARINLKKGKRLKKKKR